MQRWLRKQQQMKGRCTSVPLSSFISPERLIYNDTYCFKKVWPKTLSFMGEDLFLKWPTAVCFVLLFFLGAYLREIVYTRVKSCD